MFFDPADPAILEEIPDPRPYNERNAFIKSSVGPDRTNSLTDVATAARNLSELGFLDARDKSLAGERTNALEVATWNFQKEQNSNNYAALTEDAAYGPQTQAAIIPALRRQRDMRAAGLLPNQHPPLPKPASLPNNAPEAKSQSAKMRQTENLISYALDEIERPWTSEEAADAVEPPVIHIAGDLTDEPDWGKTMTEEIPGSALEFIDQDSVPMEGIILARAGAGRTASPWSQPVFPRRPRDRDRLDKGGEPPKQIIQPAPAPNSNRPRNDGMPQKQPPTTPDEWLQPAPKRIPPPAKLPLQELTRVAEDVVDQVLVPHMHNRHGILGNPMTRRGDKILADACKETLKEGWPEFVDLVGHLNGGGKSQEHLQHALNKWTFSRPDGTFGDLANPLDAFRVNTQDSLASGSATSREQKSLERMRWIANTRRPNASRLRDVVGEAIVIGMPKLTNKFTEEEYKKLAKMVCEEGWKMLLGAKPKRKPKRRSSKPKKPKN
jgi:peptidoglycan hydrolase-like protein with peptidoglycan-binding domain